MNKYTIFAVALLLGQIFFPTGSFSQSSSLINGKVVNGATLQPLIGATVLLNGRYVSTNRDGEFSISVSPGEYELEVSFIGYERKSEKFRIDDMTKTYELLIKMRETNVTLGKGMTVIGSRSPILRSVLETSVPVDIITNESIEKTGNIEPAKALAELVPSFNAQRQTFADGTDHIMPATLRGLGPDQVLVLVNGKRRHSTSHVIVTPVVGKGSVGSDLNSIPVASIERIEVLRDGASAQYGSDAIAGVVNIILKEKTGNADIIAYAGQTIQEDGKQVSTSANLGFDIGESGFLNITAEYRDRGATNRAEHYEGLIYRTPDQDGLTFEENFEIDRQIMRDRGLKIGDFDLRIGNSDQENISGFFNSGIELNGFTDLYAFGGINHRKSLSAGFYRFPNNPANNDSIYPNGFLPFLQGTINDASIAVGMKTFRSGWNVDISNTYGRNSYDYNVLNSLNRSWGENSPTDFYSGSTIFAQNTTNLNLNRDLSSLVGLPSFNLALGGEMRYENYQILQGEEASYSSVDPNYEPGAQVFPGFTPLDAVDRSRTSVAAYLGLETDITERLFTSAAMRYEFYDEFGSSYTGKASARYIFDELFTLRAAASTGFRAPSLHQRYYSSTRTVFVQFEQLVPFDVLTVNNDSRVAKALGVKPLKEETSLNLSAGFTSKITDNTILTVDAYQIDIDDRIVLSGLFTKFDPVIAELLQDIPGSDGVQFFTNAINTRTQGIDVILTHEMLFGSHKLGITLAGNYSETNLQGDVATTDKLPGEDYQLTLFNREEQSRLESGLPNSKINITLDYTYSDFHITVRNVRYGEVTHLIANAPEYDQTFSGKWLTDINLEYRISSGLSLFVGGNNILDVYPDKNIKAMQDNGRFPYNTAVTQFGFNGSYYYGGINLSI